MNAITPNKTGSTGYKYLLAGLGIGMLMMAVMLTAIHFFSKKTDSQPPAEIADTRVEPHEPELTEIPVNTAEDSVDRNPSDPPLLDERIDAENRIELIDKEELNRLQAEFAFLEWAVRAEE